MECIVRCILTHFWDRQFFFSLIHRNEHRLDDPDNREWLRRRAQLSTLIQEAIEAAIEAGQIRPVEPRIATEMLLGMVRSANRYRTGTDTLNGLVAAVVDIFLRGVSSAAGQRMMLNGERGCEGA